MKYNAIFVIAVSSIVVSFAYVDVRPAKPAFVANKAGMPDRSATIEARDDIFLKDSQQPQGLIQPSISKNEKKRWNNETRDFSAFRPLSYSRTTITTQAKKCTNYSMKIESLRPEEDSVTSKLNSHIPRKMAAPPPIQVFDVPAPAT